jgi:hypothetical protein
MASRGALSLKKEKTRHQSIGLPAGAIMDKF